MKIRVAATTIIGIAVLVAIGIGALSVRGAELARFIPQPWDTSESELVMGRLAEVAATTDVSVAVPAVIQSSRSVENSPETAPMPRFIPQPADPADFLADAEHRRKVELAKRFAPQPWDTADFLIDMEHRRKVELAKRFAPLPWDTIESERELGRYVETAPQSQTVPIVPQPWDTIESERELAR